MNWLMQQKLERREQRIVPEELLEGVRQEAERLWSLAAVVTMQSGRYSQAATSAIDLSGSALIFARHTPS
jgi:predicted MarR family transcription regulator